MLSFHWSDVGKCGLWPGSGEVQRVGEEEGYHPEGTQFGRHDLDLQNCEDNMGHRTEGLWGRNLQRLRNEGRRWNYQYDFYFTYLMKKNCTDTSNRWIYMY